MAGMRQSVWNSFERRRASVFLSAGGLMLVTIVLGAVDMVISAKLDALAGITAIVGIVLSAFGLVGLYPQLAEAAPRLARAGIILVTLPAVYLVVVLVWTIPAVFLPAWPALTTLLPGDFVGVVFILFAGGITIFGTIGLRTAVPSRPVGGFILVLAAAWFIVLGAEIIYEPIPDWVVPTMIVLMMGSLLPIGYLLRTDTGPID